MRRRIELRHLKTSSRTADTRATPSCGCCSPSRWRLQMQPCLWTRQKGVQVIGAGWQNPFTSLVRAIRQSTAVWYSPHRMLPNREGSANGRAECQLTMMDARSIAQNVASRQRTRLADRCAFVWRHINRVYQAFVRRPGATADLQPNIKNLAGVGAD